MIIDYCKDGEAIGDLSAKDYLRKKYAEYTDWHIHTSSECVIMAAQLLVLAGELPADKIKIWHEHKFASKIDSKGNLKPWPKGLCEFSGKWLLEVVRLRTKHNETAS